MHRNLLCHLILALLAATAARAESPNIVVLFADDLGYGDLGCFGHPDIRTPHLDKMAREGMRMTSFYAAPSCSPSRALLMTGRYPSRTGIHGVLGPESQAGLAASEITIAEALKGEGYRTACFGKWHLGSSRAEHRPLAHGFDEYFGLLYSNDMIRPWVQTDKPLRLWDGETPLDEAPVDQTTLTKRTTKRAVSFIRSAGDDPFFLYVPYSMVHLPVFASEDFRGVSPAGVYGDAIQEMDWSVGEILATIKDVGADENTLVVFTSDNGPWLALPNRMLQEGNMPWHAGSPGLLRGWKGNTYEGGVRVPGIARWPGRIPEGSVTSAMASVLDLYSTAVHLGGAQIPDDHVVDGVNLMPVLEGRADSVRDALFHFRGRGIEAVRMGAWKLRISGHMRDDVPAGTEPSPELFNLLLDPSERYNRAEEFPERVAEMRAVISEGMSAIEGGSGR